MLLVGAGFPPEWPKSHCLEGCLSLKLVRIIRNRVSRLLLWKESPFLVFALDAFLTVIFWKLYQRDAQTVGLRKWKIRSEILYSRVFPIPRDLKNFPNMSYTMESGKSILQVLGKRRLTLLCGGEQLFMISPEKKWILPTCWFTSTPINSLL